MGGIGVPSGELGAPSGDKGQGGDPHNALARLYRSGRSGNGLPDISKQAVGEGTSPIKLRRVQTPLLKGFKTLNLF